MSQLNNLILRKNRIQKKYSRLEANPFKKGTVTKNFILTPKKPNSARRAVVKIILVNKLLTLAYVPGIGHNLRKHSLVLLRGGGVRDVPMVNFSCVRGVFDLAPVKNRTTRRSVYGVKKSIKI